MEQTQAPCSREEIHGQLVHALWNINHEMRRIHDGKASQSRILIILLENGAMTQREMTEHLHIQPGSASELISKLENGGLILRTANAEDRRTVDLQLTGAGTALAQEAKAQRQALYQTMFACLSEAEKEQLHFLLEKLLLDWDSRFSPVEEKRAANRK